MLRRLALALLIAAAPALALAQIRGAPRYDAITIDGAATAGSVVTPSLVLGGFTLTGIGTTAGTLAAGNDARITGAAQKSANLSDLASLSTARTNLGAAASGANTDITSLGGLTAPLSGAQGGTGYSSVSAALDGLFSSTQGAILYRGAAGWAALAPTTAGYVLTTQGTGANPSWVSAGVGSAVLYTAQTLSSSQQDQVRANLSGPVSSAPSSSVTLTTTDIDRPLFPTGTPTITMANGGAGWRSGPIRNNNAATGLVTLAVPSGATLDGVTNGTTILFPFQRARIVQTGATAYVTDWIDRTPIIQTLAVASAASADIALPSGYGFFEIKLRQIKPGTSGAAFYARLSGDGGATVKSGINDYASLPMKFGQANSYASGGGGASLHNIANGINTTYFDAFGDLLVTPGNGSGLSYPTIGSDFFYFDNADAAMANYRTKSACLALSTTPANLLRLLFSTGSGAIYGSVRAIP